MPLKAYPTAGRLAKLVSMAAIMSIMIMLGHMTPKVAIAAPRDPFSLQPIKVAVFTAMMPGVHWPMAK